MPPPSNESRGQSAVAGLRKTTAYTVVGATDSHVVGTRWFTVERADGAGRGLLVAFDARLVPDARKHLERLAALRDPQLAQIVTYGVDDGTAWLIYAGTLDDALEARSGPMSMNELVLFGDALLCGLARAHAAGFVHPGIAEALVRIGQGLDGQPKPELLGLGLPLPLDRGPQDDLADVAFILYHLYMGRPPFEPGVPRDGSVRPSAFRLGRSGAAAPPTFEAAVMRALGPRSEAFATADAMRAALGAVPRTGPSTRPRTDPHMRRALVEPAAPLPPSTVSTLPTREAPSAAPGPERAGVRWGPLVLAAVVLVALGWWIVSLTETPTPVVETSLADRDPIRWTAPPPTEPPPLAPAPEPPVVAAKPPPPKKKPLPRIAMLIESTPLEPPEPPPAKPPEPTPPAVNADEPVVAKADPPVPEPPVVAEKPPATEPGAALDKPAPKPLPRKPPPKTEPLAPTPDPPPVAETTPPPETARPPETTPPPETATPPEPPSEQVPTRRVRIVTKPSGVTVKARGQVLGVTPLVLDLPLADLPIDLVFEKRGYRPSRRTVTAVEEIMLDMQADPAAPADPTPGAVPNPG